jgi:hypothetical protein
MDKRTNRMNTKLKSAIIWIARIPRIIATPILFIALVFFGTLALILGGVCFILVELMERVDFDESERESYEYKKRSTK